MDFIQSWIVPPEASASPAVYIAIAFFALMLTAVSKGGFGGGVGMVSVPLMVNMLSVEFVIGLWLPILITCDIFTIRSYPKTWSPTAFWKLSPGMLIGITVTSVVLGALFGADSTVQTKSLEAWMKLVIALIAVAFVALRFVPRRTRREAPWQPTWAVSLPVGIVSGITTTVAHAAGAIMNMYLIPQKLDKRVFVGTCGRFYFIFNMIKVPFLIWVMHVLDTNTLRYGAWLMLLAPPGVWLGAWMNRRVSGVWFVRLIYLFLFLSAGKLFYDWATVVLQ